jgi:hypothetical protein
LKENDEQIEAELLFARSSAGLTNACCLRSVPRDYTLPQPMRQV